MLSRSTSFARRVAAPHVRARSVCLAIAIACLSAVPAAAVATEPSFSTANGGEATYRQGGADSVSLTLRRTSGGVWRLVRAEVDGRSAGASTLSSTAPQPLQASTEEKWQAWLGPPDTSIASGPSGTVASDSASFSFTSSQSGSSFECRLDAGAWAACSAPKSYSALSSGSHTFEVRAKNAAGSVDPQPASRTWTVSVPPPPPPTGASLYISTSGNDSNACTQVAPCRTLNRAYRLAQPGQTVEMAAGAYPDASLDLDPAKTSASDVVFKPAAGATATLSASLFRIRAKHVELQRIAFNQYQVETTAEDVTVLDANAKRFEIMSTQAAAPKDISLIGGSYGPYANFHNRIVVDSGTTTNVPKNIVIDGVDFHDYTRTDPNAHVECIQIWAADGLTIKNSTFRNCEAFDLFIQKFPNGSTPTPSNILIENNFFDCCRSGYFALRFADHPGTSWQNVTIRNNSSNKPFSIDRDAALSNVKVVSNIAPDIAFDENYGIRTQPVGVITDYNVWYAGAKVGANDRVAPHGYRNVANVDFHLSAGAAAIDNGDPVRSAPSDVDGDPRPIGAAPDAGADEATLSAPPPPPPPPPPPSTSGALLVAPSGSDANPCTQAQPCASLDRAYRAAGPGAVVEMAAGSYPVQQIRHDPAKISPDDVTIRPQPGASVTLNGSLIVYGSHLTVEGLRVLDVNVPWDGPVQQADLTFRNLDGRNITIDSARDVTVKGGDYGPSSSCGGTFGGGNSGVRRNRTEMPTNIVFDGVDFHDAVSHNLAQCHVECLIVGAANGLTVRKSRFWGCSVYDIFLQGFNGPISGVTLENNWFGAPVGEGGVGNGQSTVAFSGGSGSFTNTLIRHNSFNGHVSLDDNGVSPTYSNFRVVGNIGDLAWNNCNLPIAFSHNVWKNEACSASDRNLANAAYPYANTRSDAGMDYHLVGGVAHNLVPDSASTLGDDIDHQARPMGGARDAGADEMG